MRITSDLIKWLYDSSSPSTYHIPLTYLPSLNPQQYRLQTRISICVAMDPIFSKDGAKDSTENLHNGKNCMDGTEIVKTTKGGVMPTNSLPTEPSSQPQTPETQSVPGSKQSDTTADSSRSAIQSLVVHSVVVTNNNFQSPGKDEASSASKNSCPTVQCITNTRPSPAKPRRRLSKKEREALEDPNSIWSEAFEAYIG